MKLYQKLIILIILLFLQLSIMPLMKIKEYMPNLILIYVVFTAFFEDERAGMLLGFSAGILQDLFSLSLFGLSIIALTLTGYISGWNSKLVYGKDPVTLSSFVFAYSIVYGAIFYTLFFIFGGEFNFNYVFFNEVLYPALYNVVFAFLLSFPFIKIYKRTERGIRER